MSGQLYGGVNGSAKLLPRPPRLRKIEGTREARVKPMYLRDVEAHRGTGARADAIEGMRAAGVPIPQIMHLFAFKPDRTDHLAAFTQGVMRGPSPLLPGQRELIAALTSKLNQCLF